jgi:hypothetical protein
MFQGQASPLGGFSYDTGQLPPVGPASAELKLSATGSINVSAGGSVQGGKLVGTPGSGSVALDVGFALDGTLDVSALDYDGPIPGLSNINIKAQGSAPFDPFLIGGPPVSLMAPIPATMLPPVPLGTVPGTLQITIADGSLLTTTFQGTCLTVKDGMATYQGTASTSGTLLLTATFAFDSSLIPSLPFPPITVHIPPTAATISFGAQPAPGASDGTEGTCSGAGSTDAGPDGSIQPPPPNDSGPDPGADSGADAVVASFETATVNGTALTPSMISAFADTTDCGPGGYSVSLYFTGSGLGANTRFGMCLSSMMTGCSSAQGIEYLPDDGSGDTYNDDGTSMCGLTITSIPPGNIAGSFNGTLTDYSSSQSVTVALSFSTPLTQ